MTEFALRMIGVSKSFPGVLALDKVDLDVLPGEVHVLLGENGAGKSTLMKVLSGAVTRDAGEIELDGRRVEIETPRDAQALGIRIIYQELTLVPYLTAAENIFLGREPCSMPGLVDSRRMRAEASQLLAGLGLRIDPDRPVREMGIAQQQMVEVAKALVDNARVLVMDEPTSALTTTEIDELFATINRLTARGTAIIYISHRLEELARIGNRVTVLRDGRKVATHRIGDVDIPHLIRLMANRDLAEHFPKRRVPPGQPLLEVRGLRRQGVLHDIDLTVRAGEVVGVAGLLGAGRTEMARAIVGADPHDAGDIRVKGIPVHFRHPAEAIRRGIGFMPEDRKTQGLIQMLSVGENTTLAALPRFSRGGFLKRREAAAVASKLVKDLRIRTPSLDQPVAQLSGGNQQKVVLAKWLATGADILIMDEPTRGIDIGAKVEIYELMNQLTARGAGILMISSELTEVLGMSDRILVMHAGRIAAEFDAAGATQEQLLRAALGQAV
ncbi:MAG TPA: sugar ABC transporter ATP-binding protein [Vicinamibacterales bacterium]|jgi:ribose transport system ATP-binding protein|nr:sugar ABC transporter ATP-binding protein [Vicinamibacterales bacterium]